MTLFKICFFILNPVMESMLDNWTQTGKDKQKQD